MNVLNLFGNFHLCFQLPVNEELVWDNGTPFPEPCIDRIADTVGKVIIFVVSVHFLLAL